MSEREKNPVVETYACPDIFVTGPGRVEMLGTSNMRVTVVAQVTDDGYQQRNVVSKLVGSRADMQEIAAAILMALGNKRPSRAEQVEEISGMPTWRN